MIFQEAVIEFCVKGRFGVHQETVCTCKCERKPERLVCTLLKAGESGLVASACQLRPFVEQMTLSQGSATTIKKTQMFTF